jgi:hypothetical protein
MGHVTKFRNSNTKSAPQVTDHGQTGLPDIIYFALQDFGQTQWMFAKPAKSNSKHTFLLNQQGDYKQKR